MKYRKKPVVIEAVQFLPRPNTVVPVLQEYGHLGVTYDKITRQFYISTLEGKMWLTLKDYIITGVEGEHYPCKESIFNATYEKVASDDEGMV